MENTSCRSHIHLVVGQEELMVSVPLRIFVSAVINYKLMSSHKFHVTISLETKVTIIEIVVVISLIVIIIAVLVIVHFRRLVKVRQFHKVHFPP